MTKFTALLKSLFLNAFRGEGKKKKGMSNLLGMFISGGVFGVLFIMMTVFLGPIFHQMGLDAEYIAMIYLSSQIIVLLFGTVLMVNVMFFSKDAELLLSLPLKPNVIFTAKLIYVYLSELMLSGFMVIVTGVTYGIVCGFSLPFYLLLLLSVFVVPMVPLLLSALVSIPVMYIISYFRNKSILSTILLVAVFSVLMYFYLNFVGGLSAMGSEEINLPGEQITQTVGYMMPNINLARIVTLTSSDIAGDAAVVLAFTLGLFLTALLISTFTYRRGMSSQLEEAKAQGKGKIEFTKNSAFKSFFLKEIKEIIRNPGLSFYCLFQIVMAPLMILFYSQIMSQDIGSSGDVVMDAASMNIVKQGMSFFFIILMAIGINYTAISAISREGANFNMSKTLPAPYSYQVRVKVALSDAVLAVGLLVSVVILIAFIGANIIHALLFAGFALIFGNACNHLVIYLDAKNPKLDWESITVALKNSKASFISIFLSMGVGLPLFIGFMIIGMTTSGTLSLVLYAAFWAAFYAVAILLNYLFRRLLKNNVDRLIAEHE